MGDSVDDSRAAARLRGLMRVVLISPGACAPGFMLPPASQVQRHTRLRRLLRSYVGLFVQSRVTMNSKLRQQRARVLLPCEGSTSAFQLTPGARKNLA